MLVTRSSPFGGRTRTLVLLALYLLEESFARELSRILATSLGGVQQALRGLETAGLVSARTMGRTRLFRLNPTYFAARELSAYLGRLAEPEEELRREVEGLRRRPRRTGKAL